MVPVGPLEIVAVRVTGWPNVDGFGSPDTLSEGVGRELAGLKVAITPIHTSAGEIEPVATTDPAVAWVMSSTSVPPTEPFSTRVV
jgi:hypothetical protein